MISGSGDHDRSFYACISCLRLKAALAEILRELCLNYAGPSRVRFWSDALAVTW